ncbi:MAG: YIP1 family protein [Chitinispirillia bacterium]|nr:YIP1 family protein [Chitinispirillia bacterium]
MSNENVQSAMSPSGAQAMRSFTSRMLRAAKLDASLYDEVESDRAAMGQAVSVIILSSIASGIGGGAFTAPGILVMTLAAFAGWFLWAFLTFFIGTRFLPQENTRADYSKLLRTIGFASSPGLIRIFGIIPTLRSIVFFAAAAWMVIAMVVAVREALSYTSTMRAVAVVAIGWAIQFIVLIFIMGIASRMI